MRRAGFQTVYRWKHLLAPTGKAESPAHGA